MRTYIGIDPGTESMGIAFYFPEVNDFEIIKLKRHAILEKYYDGKSSTFNILHGFLEETKSVYFRNSVGEDRKGAWIERTFSIHSPIYSPLLVVMTTIIKEELDIKSVSVKHWRKVLTDKGNISKKDCIALLKKTYVCLEDKTNDEIEALGIAIACAVENKEPNPINPISNRAIRKINRKSKTKNGKKHISAKSSDGDISRKLNDGLENSSSTQDISSTQRD